MATATYSPTRSDEDITELWRKVQKGVVVAAQFGVEEWNWLGNLESFDVDWSAREITMELDINDGVGAATIHEGGKEARPSSPTAVTATVTWILINKRFTISLTAKYISQRTPRAMLESQLRWQSKKAVQTIRRKTGDMFYGFSTGKVCEVGADASGAQIDVKDLYGITGLGANGENRAVTDLFRGGAEGFGDYIAIVDPAGPTLRGIERIASVDGDTQITLANAVSGQATSDDIYFANNLENTTLDSGTEKDMNLIGLLDGITSTSVHGVSSSTNPKWAASTNDSSGGRFTGIKLRKGKQGITNLGGGTMTDVIWANGVENDVVAQLQAGLRFADAFALEMDGMAKSKGISFMTSRRVPDGHAWGFDKKNSVRKMVLLPEPGTQAFADGDKLQDDSGLVFSLDYPCQMTYTNRGNMAMWSGLQEQ